MTIERFLRARDLLIDCRTDYERAYAEFRWPELSEWNWALDFFDVMARDNHRLALRVVRDADATQASRDTQLSFVELSERSSRLANYLRRIGIGRGDRVLVMLPNTVELWESLLALMKLGAVMAPATTLLPVADLLARVQRGDIKHVIIDGGSVNHIAALPQQVSKILVGSREKSPASFDFAAAQGESALFVPEGKTQANDPFLLYFTSGTTAQPKLVLHTHASYPVGHLSTMYWIGIQPGDVHYNISSPGWAKHAWSSIFAPWNAGAAILSHHYARFSATDTLALLSRAGVNTLCAPPTVWRLLLLGDLGARPAALREVCSAGEPLNPEVIERVRAAWGLVIRDGFGQTETTALVGNTPGQPVRLGSMGRPLPGYRMVLLDAHDQPIDAPAGEGEIAVALSPRPLGVMAGYCDDAERTAAVTAGGYYRTGDEASRDSDGYYLFIGRGDDVFKSSDYRVSPFELESALLEHPSVAEAAVVPSPDALRLSVPKAFIMLRPGVPAQRETARELFAFVRKRLAPYLRIRRIEFAELPKTISGKIRRVALRQLEKDRAAQPDQPTPDFRIEDFSD